MVDFRDALAPKVPNDHYVMPESAHFRLEGVQKTIALMAELCGNSRNAAGHPIPINGEYVQAVLDNVAQDLQDIIALCHWPHAGSQR